MAEPEKRLKIASNCADFIGLISKQIEHNATSFEIVSFALIKLHLEKFACKIYRDTRTSAHDRGVDLATNFGVVYQVKKLSVRSKLDTDKLYAELKLNFDITPATKQVAIRRRSARTGFGSKNRHV